MIRRYEDEPQSNDAPPAVSGRRAAPHPAREVERAKVALMQVGRRARRKQRKNVVQKHPVAIAAAAAAAIWLIKRSPALKAGLAAAAVFAAKAAIQRGVIQMLQHRR